MLQVPSSELHVWPINLATSATNAEELESLLSADEVARAERFRFERDRLSFVASRAALRLLLGRYLGKTPHQIRFSYSENGKPRLSEANALHFNLSHSGNMALLAFAHACEVGVDIEEIRLLPEFERLAEDVFTVDERAGLIYQEQFFQRWTRKEAVLKATGEGFSGSLITPDSPGWSVHNLEITPSYAAAAAYRHAPLCVRQTPIASASSLLPSLISLGIA